MRQWNCQRTVVLGSCRPRSLLLSLAREAWNGVLLQPDKCPTNGTFPTVCLLLECTLWYKKVASYISNCSIFVTKIIQRLCTRVANVVTDYDDLLTPWRPIKMSKFCPNIFLIQTTSNYFWASEVSKNQVFKSHFFHLPMHLTNE